MPVDRMDGCMKLPASVQTHATIDQRDLGKILLLMRKQEEMYRYIILQYIYVLFMLCHAQYRIYHVSPLNH